MTHPNNGYRNGTYAGRFGVAVGNGTNVYGTVRYLDGRYGSPNGFDLFRIADDSVSPIRIRCTSAWPPIRRSVHAGRRRSDSDRPIRSRSTRTHRPRVNTSIPSGSAGTISVRQSRWKALMAGR